MIQCNIFRQHHTYRNIKIYPENIYRKIYIICQTLSNLCVEVKETLLTQ